MRVEQHQVGVDTKLAKARVQSSIETGDLGQADQDAAWLRHASGAAAGH
jgi:hypothetical protein